MNEPQMTPSQQTRLNHDWLMSVMLRRPEMATRLVNAGRRLAGLSRPRQTRLLRRLGLSVSSATLMLALAAGALTPSVHAQVKPAATITVVNGEVAVSVNGKCSLIEAIQNANDTKTGKPNADCVAGGKTGSDTIQLPANGTFTLNNFAHASDYYGNTGLPLVTSAIVIAGNGSTIQRGSGAAVPNFRLLEVEKSGDLTLQNVKLRGGYLDVYYGGAISTRGKLKVTGSTVSGSTATSGGAIYGYKAAITIESSTLTDNTSDQIGGAVAMFYGNLTVKSSTFSGNNTSGGGGVIYTYGLPVEINGSTFNDNVAGDGGALNIQSGNLKVTGSTFTRGEAYIGGAIYTNGYDQATVALNEVTISDNRADSAAALVIKNAKLTVDRSTINNNTTSEAYGTVNLYYGDSTISNSTISNNSAPVGAGLYLNYVNASLVNVTLTGNTASGKGGGIYLDIDSELRLTRTIVSGNSAPNGPEVFNAGGTVKVNDFNLFGTSNNAGVVGFTRGATDIVATGAIGTILQPLANNGGTTKTHALAANSPAIDRAPTTDCNAAPTGKIDQRGLARGVNGNGVASANECDLGAFEAQPAAGLPTITKFAPPKALVGKNVTINGKDLAGTTDVTFNGMSAPIVSKAATKVVVTVPAGATSGKIAVTTPGGTVESTAVFTVIPAKPTVTGILPTSGPVGTWVTIQGTNLTGATSVKFGSKAATEIKYESGALMARVPVGSKTGVISVTTLGGTAKSKAKFTVTK